MSKKKSKGRKRSKRLRLDIRGILIEILSVVFAVLLALFLNEWRNNIKDDQLLEKARTNLQEELTFNQQELEQKIRFHQSQLENLNLLKDSIKVFDQPFATYDMGVAILNIRQAAWQSIILTDVVNQLEFSELNDYSELYQAYQLVIKLQDSYIEEAFSLAFNQADNSEEAYQVTRSHLTQMIAWEKELLNEVRQRIPE